MGTSGAAALLAELAWLRALLATEILRDRSRVARVGDALTSLYIGEDQVDRLLVEPLEVPVRLDAEVEEQARRRIAAARADADERARADQEAGRPGALDRLAWRFGLDDGDRLLLLVAVAPDLDPRFGTLIAYLNDDATARRATAGLALRLLAPEPGRQWAERDRLGPAGPLRAAGLVRLGQAQTWPASPLLVDERVVAELTGTAQLDERLSRWVQAPPATASGGWDVLALPAAERHALAVFADRLHPAADGLRVWSPGGRRPTAALAGVAPVVAAEVAAAWAASRGWPLLVARARALAAEPDPAAQAALLAREARLRGGLVAVVDAGWLVAGDERAGSVREALAPLLRSPPTPLLLASERSWDPGGLAQGVRAVVHEVAAPTFGERLHAWRERLAGHGLVAGEAATSRVAATFALSLSQVAEAAEAAADRRRVVPSGDDPVGEGALLAAARSVAHHHLDELARAVPPGAGWDDLVLPSPVEAHLREIAAAVRARSVVLDEWGFARRYRRGRGTALLFSGPSGCGKTLAAEVLAADLGLELCAVDLASVVSKYIGETEKNLRRLFDEAADSHVVLFFDEADALFARRSEVSDALDRYANLEVAYLLQLMEAYPGVAILATNLRSNLDEAVVRRLHHVVEFPFPDPRLRARIWRRSFPDATPLGKVDFDDLAGRFELAGGNIASASLHAAQLAAADGGRVEMTHLALAVAREYQKLARPAGPGEFGPWYQLVAERLAVGGPS
jgi:hypothetical protein